MFAALLKPLPGLGRTNLRRFPGHQVIYDECNERQQPAASLNGESHEPVRGANFMLNAAMARVQTAGESTGEARIMLPDDEIPLDGRWQ